MQEKSDKIIDTQCSLTFSELLSAFDFDNSVVDEINALIQKHNQKAEDFRKSISSDEQKLELHIIAQSVPQFSVYERNLSTNSDNQRATIKEMMSSDAQNTIYMVPTKNEFFSLVATWATRHHYPLSIKFVDFEWFFSR